ncbi:MAG: zinc-binding dehydrogenase [Cyanobacteriota bacterium]
MVRPSAIAAVKEITQGSAESVLECVGSEPAMATAIGIARPGEAIGYVGVPHGSNHNFNLSGLFMNNITLRGGVAPARAYIR